VPVLHVFNKADVPGTVLPSALRQGISLSALTGVGLDDLRQALLQQAGYLYAPEGVFIARTRHVQALQLAAAHLAAAQGHAAVRDAALDVLAEELRLAHLALCQITGEFSSEDLLGEIFSRFCIGK
jgi:tRNA modification GTPase